MTASQRHLRRVCISGFKSIKVLDLETNAINILIGANGSGKSNFISLFTFLHNLSQGKLCIYVEKNGFANTFFHFGTKSTQKITIDIDVGNSGYHVEFGYGMFSDSLVFEQEYCLSSRLNRNFDVKGELGESGLFRNGLSLFGEADSIDVSEYIRKYMEGCRVYHFHDTSATAAFKQAQKLSSTVYLHPDAANLAPVLRELRTSWQSSYQEIVAAIQTVAPFFHDFHLVPGGKAGDESLLLRWTHRDHDAPFSANQLSDGTARFICMATLFLQPEQLRPDTIVLDEPELGLHPAALAVLADLIKSVSKKTQVICSTQSVTFANHFQPEDFIVVDQEKGASRFSRPEPQALHDWLENYGMGDIWTKNLIGGRPEW